MIKGIKPADLSHLEDFPEMDLPEGVTEEEYIRKNCFLPEELEMPEG